MYILSYIDNYNKEVETFQRKRHFIITFIKNYVNNYQIVYELNKLSDKTMDETLRVKIWNATVDEMGDGEIVRFRDIFAPAKIPCPVESSQKFKVYVFNKLKVLTTSEKTKLKELKDKIDRQIEQSPYIERPITGVVPTANAFRQLRKEAENRIALQEFPYTYESYVLAEDNKRMWVPKFEQWQGERGKPNFAIKSNRFEMLDTLITTLLLSFPIGKLKVSFVDFDFSQELTTIKSRLNAIFVDKYILNESDFTDWIRQKSQQLQKSFSETGDIVKHNLNAKRIDGVYELCILNSIPSSLRHDSESGLKQLIRQGHHAGIYFAFVNVSSLKNLVQENEYISLEYTDYPSNLFRQDERLRLLTMLNEEVDKEAIRQQQAKEKSKIINKEAILTQAFGDAANDFSVEIGTGNNGETLFTFESPHVLILGKTGSGKSNFLHVLLTGSMLKYGPDTLNFYIMDMKPGGVEMADYRDVPHVKMLVADPGDAPINLEFLYSVKEQIDIRARKMQRAGVRDLAGYNAANPGKPLPRIIMLIDEFQSLFDRKQYSDLSMMLEVESQLAEILAKGRSYGINVVLSTQTLAGTQIPEAVAKIDKQYFLKADTFDLSDLRKFVRELPEEMLGAMHKHDAFSADHSRGAFQQFTPDLVLDAEATTLHQRISAIMQKCTKKGVSTSSPVYYSVTQMELPSMIDMLEDDYYTDCPQVSLGRSIQIESENVTVSLEKMKGQNLLITGINEKGRFCTEEGGRWQGLRILIVSILSLLHYCRNQKMKAHFVVILNSPDIKPGSKAYKYFEELASLADIKVLRSIDEQTTFVETLYQRVLEKEQGEQLFVFVEGQDYYRLDCEINVTISSDTSAASEESRLFSFGNTPFNSSSSPKRKTLREAWLNILEQGPLCGINTVWQIQNFERAIIDATMSRGYFQNVAILYNNNLRPSSFKITEDIDFKRLNPTNDRLRMCIFDGIEVKVIAPYQIPYLEEIDEFINNH